MIRPETNLDRSWELVVATLSIVILFIILL